MCGSIMIRYRWGLESLSQGSEIDSSQRVQAHYSGMRVQSHIPGRLRQARKHKTPAPKQTNRICKLLKCLLLNVNVMKILRQGYPPTGIRWVFFEMDVFSMPAFQGEIHLRPPISEQLKHYDDFGEWNACLPLSFSLWEFKMLWDEFLVDLFF